MYELMEVSEPLPHVTSGSTSSLPSQAVPAARDIETATRDVADHVSVSEFSNGSASASDTQAPPQSLLRTAAARSTRTIWNVLHASFTAWLLVTGAVQFGAPLRSCLTQNKFLDPEPYVKLDDKVYGKGLWVTQYQIAQNYLYASPKSQALFARWYESEGHVFLRDMVNGAKAPGVTYSLGTGRTAIDLYPNARLESIEDNGRLANDEPLCLTNSGAVNYQHESGHADWAETNPFGQNLLSTLPDPAYDDFEEKRVIDQTNGVVVELNEKARYSHHGYDAPAANVTDNNHNRCTGTYPPGSYASTEPYLATTLKGRTSFYLSTLRSLPVISPTMLARASRIFKRHDALAREINQRRAIGLPIDELEQQWAFHRQDAIRVAASFKRTQDLTAACPFPTKLHTRI